MKPPFPFLSQPIRPFVADKMPFSSTEKVPLPLLKWLPVIVPPMISLPSMVLAAINPAITNWAKTPKSVYVVPFLV